MKGKSGLATVPVWLAVHVFTQWLLQ